METDAFLESFERNQSKLLGLSRKMVGGTEAPDIVQTTFVRGLENLSTLRNDGYFDTWIYRIALNECNTRRGKSGRMVSFSDLSSPQPDGNEIPFDPPSKAPNQFDMVMSVHDAARVQKIADDLPQPYRAAFQLAYYSEDDLTGRERAAILKIPESTEKCHLRRAKQMVLARM
jgi:RNA polymerase sigma-70 factor (ECF subfamily)